MWHYMYLLWYRETQKLEKRPGPHLTGLLRGPETYGHGCYDGSDLAADMVGGPVLLD